MRKISNRLAVTAVGTILAVSQAGSLAAQQGSQDSFSGPNAPDGRLSQIEASVGAAGEPAGAWRQRQKALYEVLSH